MSVQSHCFTHLFPPRSLFLPPVPSLPFSWPNCPLRPGSCRFGRQAWATGECHCSATPQPAPPPACGPSRLSLSRCRLVFPVSPDLSHHQHQKGTVYAQVRHASSGLLTKDGWPSSEFPRPSSGPRVLKSGSLDHWMWDGGLLPLHGLCFQQKAEYGPGAQP